MSQKELINVTCAIIYFEEKILVARRSILMKMPLKWEFPGGKLEDNENEVECIKREIKEEHNIEIELVKRISNSIYDYGTFQINLIPFIANYVSGEIFLAEHAEYKLLSRTELLCLDWTEADKPIVEEFLKVEI